ncbi:MAG: hypothetical protein RTU30_03115 [Candidatus Thorarchaeota archaeon]
MELQIAFLVIGILVIVVGIWRSRKILRHREIMTRLEETFDVHDIDLSGDSEYASCFSQEWVYDNMTLKTHGRAGTAFQSHLTNNTLIAAIWIGLAMGLASMMIGMLFISALRTLGVAVVVIAVGILIILGPGDPRVSEDLLVAIEAERFARLTKNDYPYVKVANNTVLKWVILTMIVGFGFVAISPWGDLVPTVMAGLVAGFTTYVIWQPALILSEISFPLALIYMTAIIPIFVYVVPKLLIKLVRAVKGDSIPGAEEDEDLDALY